MDVLTDIFNSSGLLKSMLSKRSFDSGFEITFPCELSMGFHAVTRGQAWVTFNDCGKNILLKRGDILLVKRGLDHVLSSHELKLNTKNSTKKNKTISDNIINTILISGVYQFQTPPIHPLFFELPDTIVIKSENLMAHDPIHSVLNLLSSEVELEKPGSDSVTKSLIDVLFHYVLREWINDEKNMHHSFFKAFRDKNVLNTLQAIHEKPEIPWSVEGLAKIASLSRAAYAKKFKDYTGETPANYVSKVRIQKSLNLLRTTDRTIADIAESLGFSDAFSFSKVFKKIQGHPPKEYRNLVFN